MIGKSLGVLSFRFLSFLVPKQDDGTIKSPEQNVSQYMDQTRYEDHISAVNNSTDRILRSMLENGSPGLTICVAKRGEVIWRSAFGYSDVENLVPCDQFTIMKIASISKSIFATTMVAPLIQENKLNLKSSVHDYLNDTEFPRQKFKGRDHDITIGQLLSHTSGVRHYNKGKHELAPIGSAESKKIYQDEFQYNRQDGFVRKTYRNVIEALDLFKNDSLICEPGEFNYTTYGYTLLSAVVQKILQREPNRNDVQVEDVWIKKLNIDWRMRDTYLDQDEVLIPKRAHHYRRDGPNSKLINIPYLDTSYKWAGGGLVSNTTDLVNFANIIFDLYNGRRHSNINIERETLEVLWTKASDKNYGLGFSIKKDDHDERIIYHTGCSVGSSTLLMMKPDSEFVIAIMTNINDIDLVPLGLYITEQFRNETR